MSNKSIAWYRIRPLIIKEFLFLLRDPITFFSVLIIPFIQLTLFSLTFNFDPKNLNTAVLDFDHSYFSQTLIKGLENTGYFKITQTVNSEAAAANLLQTGKTLFILTIPENFSRDIVRGDQPQALLEADGVNPLVVVNALKTAQTLPDTVFDYHLTGSLAFLKESNKKQPFILQIEQKYNPQNLAVYATVTGLIGVIMSLTFLMMPLVSLTREKERGTLENLLATPTQPFEVLFSKLFPFFLVAVVQMTLIFMEAHWVFHIPFRGNVWAIVVASIIFIFANLLLGLLFSAMAKTLYQALQLASYFLLPNVMFSGFIFPFEGMPRWAQWLGEILPLTHFIRIVRDVMIKGAGFAAVKDEIWQILLFIIVVLILLKYFYRETLD